MTKISEPSVIGFSAILPGADAPSDVWATLEEGRCNVTQIPESRWSSARFLDPSGHANDRSYTRRAAVLEDPFAFDAAYFGISEAEATQMDPQQRLLLETTARAFDHAGINPAQLDRRRTGVFVGASSSDHSATALQDPGMMNSHFMLGNTMSILSNRIAYQWDFKGPSFTVDTACSSSLFALDIARRKIVEGEIDTAVVAGVNLLLSPLPFIGFSRAQMLSKQGLCRAFAKDADGYVRAEGAIVFILQNAGLTRTLGLKSRSTVAACATNSDGRSHGMALPSSDAQAELVSTVMRQAEISPDDLAFVEAHGTGTAVGDPTEAQAIGEVYGKNRSAPLPIGSAKSNFGHLEPAAGLLGLLKAQLALENNKIPATLHADELNPHIDFEALNIKVQTEAADIEPRETPWLAAVNSFGFGGANAHAILRQAPASAKAEVSDCPPSLMLTAATKAALQDSVEAWKDIAASKRHSLAELVATANRRVARHDLRLTVEAGSPERLERSLDKWLQNGDGIAAATQQGAAAPAPVVLAFPGNGTVWEGMAREMYMRDAVFRATYDDVAGIFDDLGIKDLRSKLTDPGIGDELYRATLAQPMLYAIQIALADALRAAGLVPTATVGHSAGEVAAAVVANRLTREDGALIIATRSVAFEPLHGTGGMLALAASAEDCQAMIDESGLPIDLAADNAPYSVTASGPQDDLRQFLRLMRKQRVAGRMLDIEYPYHGRGVDTLHETLLSDLKGVASQPSEIGFFSGWMGQDARSVGLDADYWWHNARHTVNFRAAVEAASEKHDCVFVEVTPRTVLKSYIRDTVTEAGRTPRIIETLDSSFATERNAEAIVRNVVSSGGQVDEDKVLGARKAYRTPVPEYPFDRKSLVLGSDHSFDLYERNVTHALLGARRDPSQTVWYGSLSTTRLPWLADHVIDGKVLFPATGILEMFAHAVAEVNDQTKALLSSVYFLQPIELRDQKEISTRVTLETSGNAILLEVSRGNGWTLAASADVLTSSDLAPSWKLSAPAPTDAPPYDDLENIGMSYGPSFARISKLFSDDKVVRSLIDADPALPSFASRVTNADAALHGIGKLLEGQKTPLVPSFIHRADIDLTGNTAHSVAWRSSEGVRTRFNVECFDQNEEPTIQLNGLQLSALPVAQKSQPEVWVEDQTLLNAPSSADIQKCVENHLPGKGGQPSDAEVIRSAIGGRLAWDYATRSGHDELDEDRLDYARRYLADMGYPIAELSSGTECPWPELDDLVKLAIESAPSEVTLLRCALEAGSGEVSSNIVASSEATAKALLVLRDMAAAAPREFGRIALVGAINHALVKEAYRLGAHVTILAHSERELAKARTRLAGEQNLVFALAGNAASTGAYDCVVCIAALGQANRDEAKRLGELAAPDAHLLFVEPAIDCFAVMTGYAAPDASLDPSIEALSANVAFGDDIGTHETSIVVLHGRRGAAGTAGHADEDIKIVSLEPDTPVEELGLAMADAASAEAGQPTWIVMRGADRFAELTGWRRTIRNETGCDLRVAVVREDMPEDELASLLKTSAEFELNLMETAVRAPRLFEHVPLPEAARLQLKVAEGRTGFDALVWSRCNRDAPADDEVEIEVAATALNFRDVMLAQGVLPTDAFEGGFSGPFLGMECAGIVSRAGAKSGLKPGTRVVTIAQNAFDTHVTVSSKLVVPLPDDVEATVAAALPVVFLTAEYALKDIAHLQAGEAVLIHGGAGGVGLACIQLAQRIGARIFATAGSPAKRRLLEALGVEGVFDSRALDFDTELKKANGGRGADVVVNSLAGEAMERSIECLEPFGRFVELGKRDIFANSRIGLRAMKNNISYHAVDVDQLLVHRPELAERVMGRVATALQANEILPLPVDVFPAADVASAFRHVQRSRHIGKTVVEAPRLEPESNSVPIRGAWLITGGTGGFGLRTAHWLAERGATDVWLVSRTGAVADADIESLNAAGATAHVRPLDVTREQDVEALFAEIDAAGQGLNGIVHAAMVMDDGFISQMTADRFKTVMAPKVDGARHLDALSRRFDLDHFWLYSSLSARFGNPGQGAYVAANRVLEAVADARQTEGLPGLAVAWGPIDDVGFLSRATDVSDALEQRLGQLMTSTEALDTLGALLEDGYARPGVSIGFMPWSALQRDVPVVSEPLFELIDISEEDEGVGRIKIESLVAEHGTRKARDKILAIVQKEVAGILHVAPAEVDVLRPLTEIGFDSLMIMNLKLAIEERIDVDLGVVAVGSDLSLGRIVNKLFEEQGNSGEAMADSLAETHLTHSTLDEADKQLILDRVAKSGVGQGG